MAVNPGFKEKYKPQYFQMLSIVKKQQNQSRNFYFQNFIFSFFFKFSISFELLYLFKRSSNGFRFKDQHTKRTAVERTHSFT